MFQHSILKLFVLAICLYEGHASLLCNLTTDDYSHELRIDFDNIANSLRLQITDKDGNIKQQGLLGLGSNLGSVKINPESGGCFVVSESGVSLNLVNKNNVFEITWRSNQSSSATFQDCFDLERTKMNWFGGPEVFNQMWPIEQIALNDMVNMPQENNFAAITEGYWLNSRGIYIYVHDKVPLFIDQNYQKMGYVCFSAKVKAPYRDRDELVLKYTIGAFDNPKVAHINAVETYLGKPKGHPNMAIIENPIWSTWARYYRDINDEIIYNFAQEIASHGYTGQFEIDDDWETCYGSLEFSQKKFSDIKNTLQKIKDLDFRTSLWIHPFVNVECKESAEYGLNNNYFIKNWDNSTLTSWWNSGRDQAHHLDFTNKDAVAWFNERLDKLNDLGLDTFKFDAGESSWAPQPPLYSNVPNEDSPQCLTSAYVKNNAKYGDAVEVRSGWRTQEEHLFVRMIDKDSNWSGSNGLYTLITTLLMMNMNGYTNVLPDMVGGNGYYGKPSAELFVRWLQANTFMPAIQFSFVPWDYENHTEFDVVEISKKFVKLHNKYAPEIKKAMEKNIEGIHPVNGPVWWVDPENPDAHKVATQYLLGSDIVVAPVIMEGESTRDVFIPKGTWIDGNTGTEYEGPQTIKDYPAPIDVLPYFTRKWFVYKESQINNI